MSDHHWLHEWLKGGPRLGDGAMGTLLQGAGLPIGLGSDGWSVDRPEAVRAVHEAYREAGADLLQTNSFGGNRLRLEAMGLGARVAEVNAAAARLAAEVGRPA